MNKDKSIDLIYSPDEDIWYFQEIFTDKVSIDYQSKDEALAASRNNKIEWEEVAQ